MWRLTSADGSHIRTFPQALPLTVTYSDRYGWIDIQQLQRREARRKRAGLSASLGMADPGEPTPSMSAQSNGRSTRQLPTLVLDPLKGVSFDRGAVRQPDQNSWEIDWDGRFVRVSRGDFEGAVGSRSSHQRDHDRDRKLGTAIFLLSLLLFLALIPLLRQNIDAVVREPEVVEQVTVRLEPLKPTVPVAPPSVLKAVPELQKSTKKVQRAVAQNLGFLGVIGKPELRKALGGLPTDPTASPGAGPGGKEGSGGELLVGLGQGVKKVTVGNTGVAGLGGIGTKGVGGGAGGYGNTLIGSGEGKGLTSVALSNDAELEGGLDPAVVRATLQKYLSQVRACYEAGLKKRPELLGQVTLDFSIGAEGQVVSPLISRSTLGDAGVESCITRRMVTWSFPKPVGGVATKVRFPFLLKPTGA